MSKPPKEAIEMALSVVECIHQDTPRWQVPFALARKLKIFGAEAKDYEDIVKTFCEKTGEQFVDFYSSFDHAWSIITHPDDGVDGLTAAYENSQKDFIPLPHGMEPPHSVYGVVYSLAWHLAIRADPNPFILPRVRIGALLGIDNKTVTNIVRWLERYELIACVDDTYSFKRGKCKKYSLIIPNKRKKSTKLVQVEKKKGENKWKKKPFEVPQRELAPAQFDQIAKELIEDVSF